MGYQESYVTTKKAKDFHKLEDYFRRTKLWSNEYDLIGLVETIKLNEPIKGDYTHMCCPDKKFTFEQDRKFLYFIGERYPQKSISHLFDIENIKPSRQDMKWIKDVEIIFTECFPSDKIFGVNGCTPIASREDFVYDVGKEISIENNKIL